MILDIVQIVYPVTLAKGRNSFSWMIFKKNNLRLLFNNLMTNYVT